MASNKKELTVLELEAQHAELSAQLETAKTELFRFTPIAKIGQYQFETWRKKCTEITGELLKIEKQLERIHGRA